MRSCHPVRFPRREIASVDCRVVHTSRRILFNCVVLAGIKCAVCHDLEPGASRNIPSYAAFLCAAFVSAVSENQSS
jgi:hypothetical protein